MLQRCALFTSWFCFFGCGGSSAPAAAPVEPAESPPAASTEPAPAAPSATAVPTAPGPDASEPLEESEWIAAGKRADFCPKEFAKSPISDSAKPKLIKDGYVFLEGPVWVDALGALLFSEMDFNANGDNGPPSKIHRLVPPAKLDVFLEKSGSNGLGVDKAGLLLCAHDDQSISRVDLKTKARQTVVRDVDGKHFNSPNDIVRRSTGELYFTDPDWQIGKRPKETGVTGVYAVDREGKVSLVDGSLDKPNGITLSPDERTLYVGAADSVVYRYRIARDGMPKAKERFADVKEPDGMAMDCAGNLYATSHGPGIVQVLSPSGEALESIEIAPRATNAAFGGKDHKTLYVTAGSGLYALPAAIPGFAY